MRGTDFSCHLPQLVHRITPRVCGEQRISGGSNIIKRGSPPRVRGTGLKTQCRNHIRRITPACAGNRDLLREADNKSVDHPRVCGEQIVRKGKFLVLVGSPPRVRGTEISNNLIIRICRITPACAGNSIFSGGCQGGRWDHPRVCGEQSVC